MRGTQISGGILNCFGQVDFNNQLDLPIFVVNTLCVNDMLAIKPLIIMIMSSNKKNCLEIRLTLLYGYIGGATPIVSSTSTISASSVTPPPPVVETSTTDVHVDQHEDEGYLPPPPPEAFGDHAASSLEDGESQSELEPPSGFAQSDACELHVAPPSGFSEGDGEVTDDLVPSGYDIEAASLDDDGLVPSGYGSEVGSEGASPSSLAGSNPAEGAEFKFPEGAEFIPPEGAEFIPPEGSEVTPEDELLPPPDQSEMRAAVIDELKQGRVSLKETPSYNPVSTTFHALEMIY